MPDYFFDDVRREPTPAANGHDVASLAAEPAPLAAAAAASDARLQDVAASAIAAALARHGGNVSAAARALGVSRNTIYRKMPAAAQDATEPETR